MKLQGAYILLKCLKNQGVDTIFGYPGGSVLPIYDALYHNHDIIHIITAHEQGATHAADGYARTTGKVGVVLATSGPGATNTVTGIATAFRDSIPLVVITGQVPNVLIGKGSFQEVDITGITASITKKNYCVKNVSQLAYIINDAFRVAKEGRPGPVLIDIPKDVQTSEIEFSNTEDVLVDTVEANMSELENSITYALEMIKGCQKPLIYAGGGVISSDASAELLDFAEMIKAPVTCSLMGQGSFPGDHKYFLGMVGMHGNRYSNYAVCECDLLIAIGARFSDRVISKVDEFAPKAKIIHIDIDPMEFGKNVDISLALCGDVKKILKILNLSNCERNETSWNEQIQNWKKLYPLKCNSVGKLNPQYLMEALYKLTKGDCIITTEVGQNQIWTAQYFTFKKPRTFISSGGLGTMGFGLGAAIGASFGNPNNRVINIAGDGSFKMNSTELATISKYNIPIIQIVLNNQSLGMVRQWQDMFYGGRFSATSLTADVNYIKLAEAYGIKGYKISSDDDVENVLQKALNTNGPVLIECKIDKNEKVFPIVPPGAAISESIDKIS